MAGKRNATLVTHNNLCFTVTGIRGKNVPNNILDLKQMILSQRTRAAYRNLNIHCACFFTFTISLCVDRKLFLFLTLFALCVFVWVSVEQWEPSLQRRCEVLDWVTVCVCDSERLAFPSDNSRLCCMKNVFHALREREREKDGKITEQ